MWFRIDAKVDEKLIVAGEMEKERNCAICGLKRRVDYMIHGPKEADTGNSSYLAYTTKKAMGD